MRGRPLWPPAVPRLAARPSQSNPRGSGPEVLKRERGHVTATTGVAEVAAFGARQRNGITFIHLPKIWGVWCEFNVSFCLIDSTFVWDVVYFVAICLCCYLFDLLAGIIAQPKVQCGAIIMRSILSQLFTNTPHSSPVRVRYGVSFCGSSIWLIFCLSSCNYLCNILQNLTAL